MKKGTYDQKMIELELLWLQQLIDYRMKNYFGLEMEGADKTIKAPQPIDKSYYGSFILEHHLSEEERITTILAIAPHIRPSVLDPFYLKNKTYDRTFTEFGGYQEQGHQGFMPTFATALFIAHGLEMPDRLKMQALMSGGNPLLDKHVVYFETTEKSLPKNSRPLMISAEYLELFTFGRAIRPEFSPSFPAKYITTDMDWSDLVLSAATLQQVEDILDWIAHGDRVLTNFDLGKKLKPGYKCLFYGPPGTGKTLTVALIGKRTNRPVYKIDLSLIVSKYIGETEKNLAKVFDMAQHHNWILFFDEADALFGKRTETNSANDRFANQEVAYLLQRIEDFPGIVILASNLKDNIDPAFSRRFQSMINFPMPQKEQRELLWKQSFSPKMEIDPTVDFEKLAEEHTISGGVIMNVVRYCTLKAAKENSHLLSRKNLLTGIKRELEKEGITLI